MSTDEFRSHEVFFESDVAAPIDSTGSEHLSACKEQAQVKGNLTAYDKLSSDIARDGVDIVTSFGAFRNVIW